MTLELVAITPFRLDENALRQFLDARGGAFVEGWSDAGNWKILLPWPEETIELGWNDAAEWQKTFANLTLDREPSREMKSDSPFLSGWIGFIAYEPGAECEAAPRRTNLPIEPPLFFARHERAIVVDPRGDYFLSCPTSLVEDSLRDIESRHSRIAIEPKDARISEKESRFTIRHSLEAAQYRDGVSRIRESIASGDVYQVNLTRSFTIDESLDPTHLYFSLTGEVAPRCSALIHGGEWSVVSASPEVFLTYDATTGIASSRPIKGTIERTGDDDADRNRLMASVKDAAEHLMIVDLVRNDFGKVTPSGNVSVPRFRELVELKRLMHIESTVEARGLDAVSLATLFGALFPAGSITGAPKRAAVQQIRELEPAPRGVYTGAIGYIDRRGTTQWSVAIRTAIVSRDETRYHSGGGIVWESDPELEERESRAKAMQFLAYADGDYGDEPR